MAEELTVKTSEKIKKTELIGAGCLIQGVGLFAPVLGWVFLRDIGLVLGVCLLFILFVVGSQRAQTWRCRNCGSLLTDKRVNECPGCHAQFTN